MRTVLSLRNRQRAWMVPLVLPVGMRVRVNYLVASCYQVAVKSALVAAYSPRWTLEIYIVRERRLAPGSRRVVHYDLEVEDDTIVAGAQGGTQCGQLYVRLGLSLGSVDRRYLQPVPADGRVAPSLARRFPGRDFAFRIVKPQADDDSVEDNSDDDDFDIGAGVS